MSEAQRVRIKQVLDMTEAAYEAVAMTGVHLVDRAEIDDLNVGKVELVGRYDKRDPLAGTWGSVDLQVARSETDAVGLDVESISRFFGRRKPPTGYPLVHLRAMAGERRVRGVVCWHLAEERGASPKCLFDVVRMIEAGYSDAYQVRKLARGLPVAQLDLFRKPGRAVQIRMAYQKVRHAEREVGVDAVFSYRGRDHGGLFDRRDDVDEVVARVLAAAASS